MNISTHKASATSFIDLINSSLANAGLCNKISIDNSIDKGNLMKLSVVKPKDMPVAVVNMIRYATPATYMNINGKLVEPEVLYLKNLAGWETVGKHAYHVGIVLDGTVGLREVMESASKEIKQVLKGTWFAGADILITPNDGTILNMVFETVHDSYLDTILC